MLNNTAIIEKRAKNVTCKQDFMKLLQADLMAAFQLNDTIFRLHVLWWNIFWQKLYRRVVSKNKTVLCAHMCNLFKLFVCFIIFTYM